MSPVVRDTRTRSAPDQARLPAHGQRPPQDRAPRSRASASTSRRRHGDRSALETPAEEAVALCNAGSLFGDARLVVVEQVDGRRDSDNRLKGGWKAADVDAVGAYLAEPGPGTVLALVGEDVKKTTALWKACAKAGDVLEYDVEKKAVQQLGRRAVRQPRRPRRARGVRRARPDRG